MKNEDCFAAAHGYDAKELLGQPLSRLHNDAQRDQAERFVQQVTQDGGFKAQEFWHSRRDGTAFPMLMTGKLVRDASGVSQCITATGVDVSDQRALEAQLLQAKKLEAIGTLAGGIAHDFNNLLGAILGGLSLLELGHDNLSDQQAVIQDMKSLVERGAELTKQLLGFARRGKYDVRPLNLSRVLEKTSALFGRMRKDVAIELDVAPDLLAVLMDYAQLEQVLFNLFVNAGQAMPDGGRVSVRAENCELKGRDAELRSAAPGRYAKLVVADTGSGMDAATQARIFEPFFTTKAPGQGTGLGLASVYGILRGHGGLIEVHSEIGRGTSFTLYLPAAEARVEEARIPAGAIARGNGTILLVDDELMLTKVVARMLRSLGYAVLTAQGGLEAIELLREHKDDISLVILDLVMPGVSGRQTFDALREIAPDLKVLFSSGFSIDGQAQQVLDQGCSGFLQKPFDLALLSAKLRELL